MIYYLPIEPLEERYTAQMYGWVCDALRKRDVPFDVINGREYPGETPPGQFLGWTDRVRWCSEQMANVALLWDLVETGDAFFVGDFWHPGLESLAYLSRMTDKPVRVYAINYAGPLDPTDLTARLMPWGAAMEFAWYSMCDRVFVGSDFHRRTIQYGLAEHGYPVDMRGRAWDDVLQVTGLVWNAADAVATAAVERTPGVHVLWPHRMSPDKNPEAFFKLAARVTASGRCGPVDWLVSTSRRNERHELPDPVQHVSQPKSYYYAMLRDADLMVSTAFHENFGYTVREAAVLGTPVLCPRRACYPEFLPDENLYGDDEELFERVVAHLNGVLRVPVPVVKETPGIEAMIDAMVAGDE